MMTDLLKQGRHSTGLANSNQAFSQARERGFGPLRQTQHMTSSHHLVARHTTESGTDSLRYKYTQQRNFRPHEAATRQPTVSSLRYKVIKIPGDNTVLVCDAG